MNTIFDIFESHGLSGALLALFCFILYFIIKYFGTKLTNNLTNEIKSSLSYSIDEIGKKLTEQLSEQNDLLTKTIIDQDHMLIEYLVNEKKQEKKLHNQMIEEKEDLAVDINDYVTVINEVHEAQHTYILEFHNHNENLSGTPFVKFTCKYEWYDRKLHPNYIPFLGSLTDVAFAAIAQVFKDVRNSDNHCILYNDLDSFGNKNPSLYYYLVKDDTVKSLLFKGLYDKNNILIAVIVIEYDHIVNENDINFNKLHVQAAEITQLINLRYKYEE